MTQPTAAMLVIGDEILSGRTRDSNMYHLAGRLTERGINLCEVRVVSDDAEAITGAVKALSGAYDHVFTSGGIGPTHDDITADCIAAAFGVHIDVRDDARALLQAHYDRQGTEFNAARQRMARIPDGATLIENPVSVAPGFTMENACDGGCAYGVSGHGGKHPANPDGRRPLISRTRRIDRGGGDIAGPLGELAQAYPALSIGSYPFQKDGRYGANIVLRGTDAALLDEAMAKLDAAFPA